MIDITELLLDRLNENIEDHINIDVEFNGNIIIGDIIINDNRTWDRPNYDSSDGLATQTSGEVDFVVDVSVFNIVSGDTIEFDFNKYQIYETLND